MIKPLRLWLAKQLDYRLWSYGLRRVTSLRSSWPIAVTILILAIAALIPMSWFEPDKLIFRGDPMMALDPVRFWLERWSLWPAKDNLGSAPAITIASIIHQFIQAIPVWLGGDDRASEIWHFTFWFTLPGVTIALLMRALTDRLPISQWAIPVAVVFYLFNLYRLPLFGDNNHFVVYATLPLLLYWVTIGLQPGDEPDGESNNYWQRPALGFSLSTLLAAQAGTNPPQYVVLWLGVGIYGLFLTLAEWRQWPLSLKFWLTALGLSLLVNLFWLAPFAQTIFRQSDLGSAGNLNWLGDLSKHTTLPRVFRLIGAWAWFDNWRGEAYTPYAAIYQQPFWWRLALVPALLTLLVLPWRRAWNRYALGLFLIGALGLIYGQGNHPPFGAIFTWSAQHLPFFWIFRSPWYKFTNLTAFSYATLIGLGIGYLAANWQAKRAGWWAKPLPWLASIIITLVMIVPPVLAHPLITGRLWLRAQDVSNLAPDLIPYPTHIRQAADWLNSQPGDTGVALLPYQGAAIYRWGYSSLIDPMLYFSRRPVFSRGDRIGYVPGETPGASVAYRVFVDRLYSQDKGAAEVARLLGIEYIVERRDIKYEFYDDTDSPLFVAQRLANIPGLVHARSFGDLDIYRLSAVKPNPVFATTRSLKFDGHPLDALGSLLNQNRQEADQWPAILFSRPIKQPNPDLVNIIDQKINKANPAPILDIKRSFNDYKVTGTNPTPFLLVLNQSFDPLWQATSPNATLSGPLVANGYAPVWLVEPKGAFTIKINYRPQRLVIPLTLISGLTALLGLILFSRLSLAFKPKIR